MSLTFFTICSKNFTAYARTLYASIMNHHPDAEMYMFLCDGLESGYEPALLPFPTVLLDQLNIPDVEAMSLRYNITEFNTAIKPYAFSHLFRNMGKERVVYLDPDILVTSRFEEVFDAFDRGAECILTPHILRPAENVESSDDKMLLFGIYNLGFVGFRNTQSVQEIVDWWGRRLEYGCVIDLEKGLFVDQKWADLFPAFIKDTVILHHPGYNVAYWNLSQRIITSIDGKWYANGQPLRFTHFSGNNLADRNAFSRHSGTFNRDNIGELSLLLDHYRQSVFDNGHAEYSKLPYSFNWNGQSGVNLHAPKPGHQPDIQRNVSATRIVSSGWRKTNWFAMMRVSSFITGGWTTMVRRAVVVLLTEGVGALKQRIDFARALASRADASADSLSALPRIFVTDWSTPRPDQDAGSVTTFFLLKILVELGYCVTFVPSDLEYQGEYTDALRNLGVECLHREEVISVQSYLHLYGAQFSAFLLFRSPIAGLHLVDIRKFSPKAKVILETVDLHYLRDERAAETEGTEEAAAFARSSKSAELAIIAGCDVSIVLSSFEKELLNKELPFADIRTMPLLFLDMPEPSGCGFEGRKDIVFIGSFRHTPNIDAVNWFCNEIWPMVHERLPEARFLIIGSNPTDDVLDLGRIPGVTVLGFVKDIGSVFDSVLLSVAPLRYGAGIKGKIATSMGYGVPVVGTSLAFEGMELLDNEHVLMADTIDDFAEAIVRAYTDAGLWSRLSRDGLKRVNELYSEAAGRVRIKHLMDSIGIKSSDFEFYRFGSYHQYNLHRERAAAEYRRREEVEAALIRHDADSFHVDGYCAVCHKPTMFQVGFMYSVRTTPDGRPIPNWREHLNCLKCGFTNRNRLTLQLLKEIIRPAADARIYITEQTTSLFRYLQTVYPKINGSEYLGDAVQLGAVREGLRNEDMTRLTFPDGSFDLILSFDVLEHVADEMAAFAECYRCLSPGGIFLFTAPFDAGSRTNIAMARIRNDGTLEHLITTPEYHGNPVEPEKGALCFRYLGWETLAQLKTAGFEDPQLLSFWSRDLGYLGGEQFVFVARKGTA